MSQLIPHTTPLREFKDHENTVFAVAVFPDRRRMVTSSQDETVRLWDLETGVVLKKMEGHGDKVMALAVSRDGQLVASGDLSGVSIIWHGETGEPLTQPITAHSRIWSLDFSPEGTVLATGGPDTAVKLWSTKTWEIQGDPIICSDYVHCFRYSPSGELLAIATSSNIEIYNPGTRECIANFKLNASTKYWNNSLRWTPDGTRLLSGDSATIRVWDTSTWKEVGDGWMGHTGRITAIVINPAGTLVASASDDNHVRLWRLSARQTVAIFQHSSRQNCVTFSTDGKHILSGGDDNMISEWEIPKNNHFKILPFNMSSSIRNACITGDLSTAEMLLTQEIDSGANNYHVYAYHSIVMTRQHQCDNALQDAIKSISIKPSLMGYISKGIALSEKGQLRDSMQAFDMAFMFANEDSKIIHFILLIKAIAMFNAGEHDEAILRVRELASACPNNDTHVCHVIEAYLSIQLGINASDGARHEEAAGHFAAAVNSSVFSTILTIYDDLVVLFGWDLESMWLTASQKLCQALLSAGKVKEALEAHQSMMDTIDKTMKASYRDWSNTFKEECSALAATNDILRMEIPGQDQEGYDTEPDFFRGMHDYPQTSRSRPRQRQGRLKRLRVAVTRTLRPAPPPVPPTMQASATAPATFRSHLRDLLTWRTNHAAPHVVDVPYAQGRLRNAAADAPRNDDDLVPDEYFDDLPQDPNSQQQPTAGHTNDTNDGDYGGGRSCFCC